jgi:hypothetical protein
MKHRVPNILGNVAKARDWAFIKAEEGRRIAQLIRAIETGAVRAPASVLSALREMASCKPRSGQDEDAKAGIPKVRACPSLAIGLILDRLADFVHQSGREERIGAASCIAYLAEAFRTPLVPDCPKLDYCSPKAGALLKAVLSDPSSGETPEVQRDLLKALPVFRFGGNELFPVLVQLLRSQEAEVRKSAVFAIREFGVDLAAGEVLEFAKLLKDPMETVRRAACEILKWLRADAVPAVPAIVDFLHDSGESDQCILAVEALLAVDPKGKALSKVKNQANRDAIILALSRIGESGRLLRQQLPRRWEKDDVEHPGKWMSIPEIATAIGMPKTTLRHKIGVKIHPHDKDGKGKGTKYLVTETDLKAWKQL